MKLFLSILISFLSYQISFAQGGTCSHKHDFLGFLNKKRPIAPTDFDIKNYIFDLNIERNSRSVSGNVTLKFLANTSFS